MKAKISKYSYLALLLYFPIYLAAFQYIENHSTGSIHIIECALDHKIPFIEFFVIPYLLWFVYIGVGGFYFLFREKESFLKMMYIGMIGMTTFIVVSLLYKNGLELRPTSFARDNIFVELTKFVYSMDTPTNVFPSIHVYNSLGMCCVIAHSETLKRHKIIQVGNVLVCASIILATMFLKQHSVFDVVCAMALFVVSYGLVYGDVIVRVKENIAALRYQKGTNIKNIFDR